MVYMCVYALVYPRVLAPVCVRVCMRVRTRYPKHNRNHTTYRRRLVLSNDRKMIKRAALTPRYKTGTGRQNLQFSSVQFSAVQSLDRLGRRGDMRDDSAEILFQFFFFFLQNLINAKKALLISRAQVAVDMDVRNSSS